MTSNPAFVIVPGVSHTPIFFQSVVDLLNRRGYQAKTVAYPTVGYNVSGTTYNDEVKSIQDAVAHYVENQHTDVILVCHSYGGWPGSRAVKGWDKTTREQLGLQNGIIELVFLAAFLIPDNAPMAAFSVLPDWLSNNVSSPLRNLGCSRSLSHSAFLSSNFLLMMIYRPSRTRGYRTKKRYQFFSAISTQLRSNIGSRSLSRKKTTSPRQQFLTHHGALVCPKHT